MKLLNNSKHSYESIKEQEHNYVKLSDELIYAEDMIKGEEYMNERTSNFLNTLKWKHLRPRRNHTSVIDGPIFFGDNGNLSMIQCYTLHQELEKAFVALSMEQQNGLQGYEYDPESAKESYTQVVAVIQQISIALTGSTVTFNEKGK